jgi:hypothetical protein
MASNQIRIISDKGQCLCTWISLSCCLQVGDGAGVSLLEHPLSTALPVVCRVMPAAADGTHGRAAAGGGGVLTGWSGEAVLWSSTTQPFVATFSKVRAALCC